MNGVVLTARGYHPIGEAMDDAKLISYVQQAAMDALSNMEPAEVSWRMETVPNIRVIGEEQIRALGLIAEKTAKQAKKLGVSLFSATSVLLIALLIIL